MEKSLKMKTYFILTSILLLILNSIFISSCKKHTQDTTPDSDYIFKAPISDEKIPDDIEWLTNDTDPLYASPEAKKGGKIRAALLSFPLTFRVVGPDSNSGFRSAILGNQLGLIGIHPNTENITPEIATHWAFDEDKKTMYFKLNKNARWSDGVPVTAHDFAYKLEFMRSEHIVAPWYNDYYTKEIDKIIVYDDYTLAVVSTKQVPDLHIKIGITPIPRHFYGKLNEDFVMKYNWKIAPNTGPYQIADFKKGKYITFERKKDWWAKDLRCVKNRFNIDKIIYKVIKDYNMIWEYFKKGKVDVFGITLPTYWHDKSRTSVIENGYVHKIWYFYDTKQSSSGLYLNQDKEIFKDKNVRYAFAHSINIKKVIEKVLHNDYFRLEHGFIGYGRYTNNDIKAKRYNLEKVNYYMKKSGWIRGEDGIWIKNGLRFSVEIVYSSDTQTPRLVVLKEEAQKAGIELRLQELDGASRYKKVMEKKHDVAWMGWSTSMRPQYWEHLHSDNAHKPQTNNITNTDDPEMDNLIEAYRNSLDEKERINISLKIQGKIHEIGAYVPTFMVPYVRIAYWRWLKLPDPPGTKVSESLFDPFPDPIYGMTTGGLFWYDEELHKETLEAMKKNKKFDPVTIIDETYKMDIIK